MNKKKHPKKRRGNPIFNFRLPLERANKLREVAKIFGSPSASDFVRECIFTVIGGNPDEIGQFVRKFQQALADQMMLELRAVTSASQPVASELPNKPKRRAVAGKGVQNYA